MGGWVGGSEAVLGGFVGPVFKFSFFCSGKVFKILDGWMSHITPPPLWVRKPLMGALTSPVFLLKRGSRCLGQYTTPTSCGRLRQKLSSCGMDSKELEQECLGIAPEHCGHGDGHPLKVGVRVAHEDGARVLFEGEQRQRDGDKGGHKEEQDHEPLGNGAAGSRAVPLRGF